MRTFTYTCDRCGGAIDSTEGRRLPGAVQLTGVRLTDPVLGKERDLCGACVGEFVAWLGEPR